MSALGIEINEAYNQSCPRGEIADITAEGAKVKTYVIPTNEEYMIALDTQNLTK
jgi:acetate kinase